MNRKPAIKHGVRRFIKSMLANGRWGGHFVRRSPFSHNGLNKSLKRLISCGIRMPCSALILLCSTCVLAQDHPANHILSSRSWAPHVIIPQTRAFAMEQGTPVQVTQVDVGVAILEQVATTTMDISVRNPGASRQEAELLVPVPTGAVVKGFTFQGSASEPTAKLLIKDEARKTYDAIVAKVRDPALLEFIGYNLIRSSVFPVEPNNIQKVRIIYEQLLTADGNRIDYILPRSESVGYSVPWTTAVKILSKQPISTVYSPSHKLETARTSEHAMSAHITSEATTEPGPFRLSYMLQQNEVTASLFAYPDPSVGGGYFLLLAGLPAKPSPEGAENPLKREVTVVIDHSGSMNGEKMDQVKLAAIQVLTALQDGEVFNIIIYNEAVELFSKEPVLINEQTLQAARVYLKGIKACGGTNIHDALLEALRQKPAGEVGANKEFLPIVLFLTDGLPTIGQTSEVAIRNLALQSNPHQRRIFTFGVGVDVNTPLLEKIAAETRAATTYVFPKESVDLKVDQTFKRLSEPVLAYPTLEMKNGADQADPGRVRDVMPNKLPDLFEGDQLVLLGQYTGNQPLHFTLNGNYLGKERSFSFAFNLDSATTRHAFVPRLWASRKIGVLVDAIRDLGADSGPTHRNAVSPQDPRIKELVDEIVRLSKEFGILTEYTAFLALEGTNLNQQDNNNATANDNLNKRAFGCRSGVGSVNQSLNNDSQMKQNSLNRKNGYYDEKMNRVEVANVQQIGDRTFYKRGGQWVDSRAMGQEGEIKPENMLKYGTPEYEKLMERMIKDGSQGCLSVGPEVIVRDEVLKVNYKVSF